MIYLRKTCVCSKAEISITYGIHFNVSTHNALHNCKYFSILTAVFLKILIEIFPWYLRTFLKVFRKPTKSLWKLRIEFQRWGMSSLLRHGNGSHARWLAAVFHTAWLCSEPRETSRAAGELTRRFYAHIQSCELIKACYAP